MFGNKSTGKQKDKDIIDLDEARFLVDALRDYLGKDPIYKTRLNDNQLVLNDV